MAPKTLLPACDIVLDRDQESAVRAVEYFTPFAQGRQMSFNRINSEEQVLAKPAVQLRRCTGRLRCPRVG